MSATPEHVSTQLLSSKLINQGRHNMNKHWLGASLLLGSLILSACGGGDDEAPPTTSNPLAVDSQFGQQGSVQLNLAPYGGALTQVLELPDGKLMLLGHRKLDPALVSNGTSDRIRKRPNTHLFARRLLANGQSDQSFGEQGTVEWQVAGADEIEDAIALPDGSVALTALGSKSCFFVPNPYGCVLELPGSAPETRYPRLQRLLVDGSIDRSATPEGYFQLIGWQTRLARQQDKLLVVSNTSYSRGGFYNWVLSRHAYNTAVDSTFGQNGLIKSRCETDGAMVQVDGNNAIWLAGVRGGNNTGLCMERLQSDGTPHNAMPQPLEVTMNMQTTVADMRVLSDQRVLVAGTNSSIDQNNPLAQNFAVSVSGNGQLSSSYGQQGIARMVVPAEARSPWYYNNSTRINAAGEVVYMGSTNWIDTSYARHWTPLTARFTPQGHLDTSLGQTGVLRDPVLVSGAEASLAQIDAQGRWLVVSGDGAVEDQPTTLTLTRLQGSKP